VHDTPGVPVEEGPIFVRIGRRPIVQCLTCGHTCILVDSASLYHMAHDDASSGEG
jgi:hypothetical protein